MLLWAGTGQHRFGHDSGSVGLEGRIDKAWRRLSARKPGHPDDLTQAQVDVGRLDELDQSILT